MPRGRQKKSANDALGAKAAKTQKLNGIVCESVSERMRWPVKQLKLSR